MRSLPALAVLVGGLLTLAPVPLKAQDRKKSAEPRLTVSWEERTLQEVATDLGVWLDIRYVGSHGIVWITTPEDAVRRTSVLRGGTGGEEAWEYKGTSMRLVNGRLFVRHTPEVHAKVRKILQALGTF